MKKLLPYFFILFAGVFFMPGCQEPKDLEYRSYKNLKLANIGFDKATLTTDLVMYNPNAVGVELNRMDLDIFVDGNLLGHTAQNIQVSIPARKEFTIPLVINVDVKNLLKNGYTSLMNKEVNIQSKGSVRVGKLGVYKSFPVDYTTRQSISF